MEDVTRCVLNFVGMNDLKGDKKSLQEEVRPECTFGAPSPDSINDRVCPRQFFDLPFELTWPGQVNGPLLCVFSDEFAFGL
jgi:hypothetical protein